MADAPPPPYPGSESEKGGYPPPGQPGYPPPGHPGYPPQGQPAYPPGQYPPPQGGYPAGPPPPAGYAPPPQGYQQPGQPHPGYPVGQPGAPAATTVVVTQQPTTTVMVQQFRETSVQTICPHCQANILTATTYESGSMAWLICCILFWIGCDLGCCLIPFCVDGCKDVIHSCPNCHQTISRWSRL